MRCLKYYYGIVPFSHLVEVPLGPFKNDPNAYIVDYDRENCYITFKTLLKSSWTPWVNFNCVIDNIHTLKKLYWLSSFNGDLSAGKWFRDMLKMDQIHSDCSNLVLVMFSKDYINSFKEDIEDYKE